ncbi:hypothetical protein F2P81_023773 [Scophthalmus maximus]|uniref:Uncharacterized protein n=1 Tax=Scophthalmus maximus TaxID=52904 RepID=A0A6A4RMQ5_SCOMX|nr:hypothetical protein F2P81_023773 [Scophthalmus maximus]
MSLLTKSHRNFLVFSFCGGIGYNRNLNVSLASSQFRNDGSGAPSPPLSPPRPLPATPSDDYWARRDGTGRIRTRARHTQAWRGTARMYGPIKLQNRATKYLALRLQRGNGRPGSSCRVN